MQISEEEFIKHSKEFFDKIIDLEIEILEKQIDFIKEYLKYFRFLSENQKQTAQDKLLRLNCEVELINLREKLANSKDHKKDPRMRINEVRGY